MTRVFRYAAGFRVLQRHLRYAGINPRKLASIARRTVQLVRSGALAGVLERHATEAEQYADYGEWCARYEPGPAHLPVAAARTRPEAAGLDPHAGVRPDAGSSCRSDRFGACAGLSGLGAVHRRRCVDERSDRGAACVGSGPRPAHPCRAPREQRWHRRRDQRRARVCARRVLCFPRSRRHPRAATRCSR